MENLTQNFQTMIDYYFYSGKTFERLILPCLVVIIAIILIRFLVSFFFQTDAQVKHLKNINKSLDGIASHLSEQNKLMGENKEKFASIDKITSEILENQKEIFKSLEKLEKLAQDEQLKDVKVNESCNTEQVD